MIRPALIPAAFGAVMVSSVHAAAFVVDTTADAMLGACTAAPADCSLRGAITSANASPGPHDIRFDLPPDDPGYIAETAHWRIAPIDNLPGITRTVTIDGYSQPGAVPNSLGADAGNNAVLKIELRGASFNSTNGLGIGDFGAQLTVRGLAINGFQTGIQLYNSSGAHRVEGCFIGTDISGLQARPNTRGISISGAAQIGGLDPAARNVLSGNSYAAVISSGGSADGVHVAGNLVGLAADGSSVLPGQDYGLLLSGPVQDMWIGGDVPAAANVIAGNEFGAVYFSGSGPLAPGATPLRVLGNRIGTDASGVLPAGNGLNPGSPSQPQATIGAFRLGTCGIAVGGAAAGEGNLIAHGGGAGVHIATCRDAPIHGNTFRANRGLAIDLSANSLVDGPTANDVDDLDGSGKVEPIFTGNRFQNTVEVLATAADADADELLLTLRVDSAPSAALYPLRVDVYRSDTAGMYPVATETIAAEAAHAPFDVVLPLSLAGQSLAFTVTDADGNTSEFARTGGVFGDGFEAVAMQRAP